VTFRDGLVVADKPVIQRRIATDEMAALALQPAAEAV
jgi:hypothetical protein